MKKKVIAVVLILVLVSGNISYWLIDRAKDSKAEENQLIGSQVSKSFIQTYGKDARISQVIEPQKIFLVVGTDPREDGTYQHVSLYIDGLIAKLSETKLDTESND